MGKDPSRQSSHEVGRASPSSAKQGKQQDLPSTEISSSHLMTDRQTSVGSTISSQCQTPIRHSGRALVRGKIRRVWRPRYMEVLDNGLVRYFEVAPPTPSTTMDVFVDSASASQDTEMDYDDDQFHSKFPKCTLMILHARIIDVTTLRDMHVGLPRGSFGFLFNGRRIGQDDIDDEDAVRDNIQLLTMGQACQGNVNLATPRDFLCAVNSLEEAQSWVIALQWAASMGKETFQNAGAISSSTTSFPYTGYSMLGASAISKVESLDSLSLSSASLVHPPQHQLQMQEENQTQSSPSSSPPTKKKSSAAKPTSITKSKTSHTTGKFTVMKALEYNLVRVDTWKWQFAYQIQVLLVLPATKQGQVQEWRILRTSDDLENLVDQLMVSLELGSSATLQSLEKQKRVIATLPNLQQSKLTEGDLSGAVTTVDNILRSLCMEAAAINSSVMKQFLGLHYPSTTRHVQAKPSIWKMHNPRGLVTIPKRTILNHGIDKFVKQWLQRPTSKLHPAKIVEFKLLCWFLRLPQPTTIYTGLALLLLWLSYSILPPLNRFIRKFQVLPYITLRVDILLLSWGLALGVGEYLAQTRQQPRDSVSSVKKLEVSVKRSSDRSARPQSKTSPAKATRQATSSSGLESSEDGQAVAEVEASKEKGQTDKVTEITKADGEVMELESSSDVGRYTEQAMESSSIHEHEAHLSSPLPMYNREKNVTTSCWSKPRDNIFNVRGLNYLTDRIKIPSGDASFTCQGVDVWLTDNAERHIARHPSVMGGKLATIDQDIFMVNFLLPFGNFVSYFSVPPLSSFANETLAGVWTRFIKGDQQYRDARLKLLPVVVDGPWIVRTAVPGKSPALLGKVIPLQYFFTKKPNGRSIYEVDVIITASSIAKGILSVVKGHAKALSIAFAFIIEAANEEELPETVLASFQVHALHLEDCPLLPECNLDEFEHSLFDSFNS